MNRLLLLFMLAALVAAPAAAQGLAYFPSNTPSGGSTNAFPFANAFGNNWRYHGLLTGANLPSAKIKITDVAIAPASSGSFSATQFQVRMGHINGSLSSSFGGEPPYPATGNLKTCPINLYDGAISISPTAGAWNNLGATCTFGYDGDLTPKPNIVLEIRYRGRTGGFSSYAWGSNPRLWANSLTLPSTTDPYTAVGGSLSSGLGIRVRLTYARTKICDVPTKGSIGTSVPVHLHQMPVGDFYQIAASLSQSPLTIGSTTICLAIDPIFMYSVLVGAPIFNGYAGTVPPGGRAGAKFAVPNSTALVGLCVYHAAICYNTGGITGGTNTEGTVLVP